jgi:hypothetical protein
MVISLLCASAGADSMAVVASAAAVNINFFMEILPVE